jgi:acetyl-CoA acetyltransferase
VTPHGGPVSAIVGVAETELGAVSGQHPLRMMGKACLEALDEAGLELRDVDGLITAGYPTAMPALDLAQYLGIQPSYADSTDIGGSSFELHVGHADAAIRAGLCEVALITYASTQRQDRSRMLGGPGEPPHSFRAQYEADTGLPSPIGGYALAAARHMYEFGTTSDQLADVAVAARAWAALNPKAFKREPITRDDVLASPLICSPLHLLDCCLVTDGGGAVVVTTRERARHLRRAPVSVLGYGQQITHADISLAPDLVRTGAAASGQAAFVMAGLGPGDVDVAQIYDSFTITVILSLEDLGFCAKGEGGSFVGDGRIAPGGNFPLNTSGGGLSYCHPGMLGLLLLVEGVRQLRGECGVRQVAGAEVAVCHGTGGVLSSSATVLLGAGERG